MLFTRHLSLSRRCTGDTHRTYARTLTIVCTIRSETNYRPDEMKKRKVFFNTVRYCNNTVGKRLPPVLAYYNNRRTLCIRRVAPPAIRVKYNPTRIITAVQHTKLPEFTRPDTEHASLRGGGLGGWGCTKPRADQRGARTKRGAFVIVFFRDHQKFSWENCSSFDAPPKDPRRTPGTLF